MTSMQREPIKTSATSNFDGVGSESYVESRPANVNADGEFKFKVSGYVGFPGIYLRHAGSGRKTNRKQI